MILVYFENRSRTKHNSNTNIAITPYSNSGKRRKENQIIKRSLVFIIANIYA